jgi:hypothetical protein
VITTLAGDKIAPVDSALKAIPLLQEVVKSFLKILDNSQVLNPGPLA